MRIPSPEEYERLKQAKIDELEAERLQCDRRILQLDVAIEHLKDETYRDFVGDARYDSWKSRRAEA